MAVGESVRSKDEILEMISCCREHIDGFSSDFATLSYEDGIINALKWLYFKSEEHPLDVENK